MIVRITSKYGEVSELHPNGHTGVDIALKEGTPLKSAHDGVVERVLDLGSENVGKGVIIRFEDGTQGIYGHLSDINVKVGEKVRDGQIIGYSGNTGHSTGPHLHFGIKENGEFVDPTPLVNDTVNHINWGKLFENGPQFDWLKEQLFNWLASGFNEWLVHYVYSFPYLFAVSVGVWGLCNMVSRKIALWGVGLVFLMGAFVTI